LVDIDSYDFGIGSDCNISISVSLSPTLALNPCHFRRVLLLRIFGPWPMATRDGTGGNGIHGLSPGGGDGYGPPVDTKQGAALDGDIW
jgi:hypothetical protein